MKKDLKESKQASSVSLDEKIKSGWKNRLKNINSKPSSKNLSNDYDVNSVASNTAEEIVAFPIGY
jgi:hypothetical protein